MLSVKVKVKLLLLFMVFARISGISEKLVVSSRCLWPCFRLSKVGNETGCAVSCRFVNNAGTELQKRADAIVGFIPQTRRLKPGQVLFAYWQESSANTHVTHSPQVMRQFNYSFSYRQDRELKRESAFLSDMMTEVYTHLSRNDFPEPIPYEVKLRAKMASTVISNTALTPNHRAAVLGLILAQAQTQNVSTAHYGRHLRNAAFPPDSAYSPLLKLREWKVYRAGGPNDFQKIKAIAQHLFHFAFENSDCPWYHTEKAYQGLAAGTIPVYLGAHTYPQIMPENSYLFVKDFASPSALVQRMREIANSKALYESFFEWRKLGIPAHMRDFLRRHTPEYHAQLLCDMCALVFSSEPHHLEPERCEPQAWKRL